MTTSQPVGGVLSTGPLPGSRCVTIHLCGPPEGPSRGRGGRVALSSVRPCSRWGLPSRPGCPDRWCALTAPFHPYLCRANPTIGGLSLCGPIREVAPAWLAPAPLPFGAPTFLDIDPASRCDAAVTRMARRRRHPNRDSGGVSRRRSRSRPRARYRSGRRRRCCRRYLRSDLHRRLRPSRPLQQRGRGRQNRG